MIKKKIVVIIAKKIIQEIEKQRSLENANYVKNLFVKSLQILFSKIVSNKIENLNIIFKKIKKL
jgi:hypothetical protein